MASSAARPGKRKAPEAEGDEKPPKVLSAAREAQRARRKAKKSTVVTGLGTVLAAAGVDQDTFKARLDAAVLAASQGAVLASELLALHLALDTENAVREVNQALCAAALRLVLITGTSLECKATEEPAQLR
jgi:hypothetical protein